MCDNCGGRIAQGQVCVLPAEQDQTTQLMLEMTAYDAPKLCTSSHLAAQPYPVKADLRPDVGRGRKRALGYFCTWECARAWNAKESPACVQSRRDLVIDLLAARPLAPIQI